GGLHYSYNISHGSNVLGRYPMNRLTDMITNFGGVLFGLVVLKKWGFNKTAGLMIMMFSAFEVVIHVVIGISSMETFGQYGQNTLYSPGLITSLFGFLPVSIAIAKEIFNQDVKPTIKQWILSVVVMFTCCFLLITLPEKVLSDENSPYNFTNRGYYEKYGEQFEEDNNFFYK
ncbi:MAG: HXXEE domain-containing protein, partial [Lachnospirales bacterium]